MKVAICTLGCRTNIYESDSIESQLRNKGFDIVDFSEFADIYIVNTCSVTQEADKKSRQMIRKGKNTNPNSYVVCLGCYSQINGKIAKEIGADFVCGNRNKEKCIEYILSFSNGERKEYIDVLDLKNTQYEYSEYVIPTRDTVKAYIKISDGCDNKCSYCIIREARGPVVSRNIDDIYNEGKKLSENGFEEIILTGTEVASYGKDGYDKSLIDVLEKLDTIDGIKRIRLASIEPSILKRDFVLRLSKLEKFAPSIHLSLQSGSNSILGKMRRKYNDKMVRDSVDLIRELLPNAEFSSDVICGFPGETDDDFKDTIELCKYIKFYHIHIFPYSDRMGTEASLMVDKVPFEIKKKRCETLSSLSKKMQKEVCRKYVENRTPLTVLFEQRKNGYFTGHAENGLEVCYESENNVLGKIITQVPYEEKYGRLYFESDY